MDCRVSLAVDGMLAIRLGALCADAPIHIALLMPFSGSWKVGKRIAGAAALAVERLNADKALLPGRVLTYSWADSGCSAMQVLTVLGNLRTAEKISAVIGPGCSEACEVSSYLAAGQNVAVISWGCIFLSFPLSFLVFLLFLSRR